MRQRIQAAGGSHESDRDAASLAYAIGYLVPFVQVPPRGIWGKGGQATLALTESWLGRPLDPDPSPDELLMRYLAAFGPASAKKDVQAWCGPTSCAPSATSTDRSCSTCPTRRGPTPALPRFLPEYDNVLLSHADRGRIHAGGYRPAPHAGKGGFIGNVLIDGFFRATYTITRQRGQATLLLTPFAHLSEESARLLAFAAADGGAHDVRFADNT